MFKSSKKATQISYGDMKRSHDQSHRQRQKTQISEMHISRIDQTGTRNKYIVLHPQDPSDLTNQYPLEATQPEVS